MKKKKVIITGAAGFVGLNLINLIDSKKYNLIVIDKNENNLKFIKEIKPEVSLINANLAEIKKTWAKYFSRADCVIQLQAQISSPKKEDYIFNNIKTVKNILKVCKKYRVKNLIHVSTTGVISAARDNYSTTKTIGEKIVRESKVPHSILRPSMIYGCYEVKHLGNLANILDKTPVLPFPGNGKYLRQPIYVGDLCKVILKLIDSKPKGQVYNIVGKEQIFFIDMMKTLTKIKNQRRIFLTLPIPIFLLLLKLYGAITGKKPYQDSQLKALTAGDIFSSGNWENEFGIKHTSFKYGAKDYISSEHKRYLERMLK
ncbi:MAG: NAD-dependent epimerase/dehydratase family protein [Nanoarchaeota archaeon]